MSANGVTRWTEHALDAVRAQDVGTPNAGRFYAMVTAAMYDAVNGIDRAAGGGRTSALVPHDGAPSAGERDVVAAAAAHAVLTRLLNAALPPIHGGGSTPRSLSAHGRQGRRRV